MADLDLLADKVFAAFRVHVDKELGAIEQRMLGAIEQRFAEIPKPKNGEPGQDADPALIARQVAEAVANIAKPRDGDDGDPRALLPEVARMVSEAIEKAAIPAVVKEAVAAIPRPKDGQDADQEVIVGAVMEQVRGLIPVVKDGQDADEGAIIESVMGKVRGLIPAPIKGDDADEAAIADRVFARVKEIIPAPVKGDPGPAVDLAVLQMMVKSEVSDQVADLPEPPAGTNGDPREILDECVERVMKAIRVPKDGDSVTIEDVTPLLEAELARWELQFERRATDLLQRAVDKFPKPADGRDGFALEDFSATMGDDGRTLVLKFAANGETREHPVTLDIPLDRGLFSTKGDYRKGDAVTYGGSMWLAQNASPGVPGDGPGWRLAVKRGQNADARHGSAS